MRILVVLTTIIILATVVFAAETSYRPSTPKEIGTHYSQQALELMVQSLRAAKIAGMIEESMRCPCYDVHTSTGDNKTFLRIDRGGCKGGHK